MSDWVREDRACGSFGVSRETVRRLREVGTLVEGEHWRREHNRVELSRSGIEQVAEALGLEYQECVAVVVWSPPKLRVKIIRMTRNRGIVIGRPLVEEGMVLPPTYRDGDWVRLRVANSQKLCKGLTVEAEHVREDLWEMVGRAPRGRREAARWAMREEE